MSKEEEQKQEEEQPQSEQAVITGEMQYEIRMASNGAYEAAYAVNPETQLVAYMIVKGSLENVLEQSKIRKSRGDHKATDNEFEKAIKKILPHLQEIEQEQVKYIFSKENQKRKIEQNLKDKTGSAALPILDP